MKKIFKKLGTIIIAAVATLCISSNVTAFAATQDEPCEHQEVYNMVLMPESYELTSAYATFCDECNKSIEIILPESKSNLAENDTIIEENKVILEPTEEVEGIACDVNENGVEVNIRTIEKVVESKFPELEKETSIFLAPSTQNHNMYYDQKNSEAKIMNEIMDLIQENLSTVDNLTITRNDANKDVLEYIKDSNASNSDLHFSLHSNGSKHHNARGPVIIANPNKSESIEWAKTMYEGLISIYPEQSYGRGVVENSKYYEKYRVNAPSIIVEIAFHDQEDDSNWILENKQQIADNLTISLIEYMNLR